MNSLAFVAAFALIACTSASVILPTTRIIEGPSSRTTLLGPDGSVIDSVNPGSKVISHDGPAIVADTAAVVPAPVAYSAPLVNRVAVPAPVISAYSSPYGSVYPSPYVSGYPTPYVSAYSAPVVSPYSAPVVSAYSAPVVSAYSAPVVSAYSAPVVAGGVVAQKDTLIAGPSGSIATSKTLATPAVVASHPSVYHGLYL